MAPIRAPRNDRAICISLKNVSVEGPSREMMEQKITPYRASPADIKPLPPVDKRVSGPPRIQNHRVLPAPTWEPAQHTKADPVLFHASATSSAPASGDSSAEETYFSRIRRLLEAAKRYPASARRASIEGSVGIGFSINCQGYLTRKGEVFRSSGSPVLDQAATACVEKVGKFPPFPDKFKEDLLKIRVDLVFELTLRGTS
ncbi:MAG: energy transducer TonB [Deltaproteobacteria bacterium]|nr:energy transducer TonB [Deltaproteobacteria bacterium]